VSEASVVPKTWVRCTLSEIAEVRLGRQRSPKQETGEHLRPYMRAANVTWQGISVHDVKEMNFTPSEAVVYELQDGDILLSEASGSPSEVGKPAIWRAEVPGACFQNTLIRVRADGKLTRFLQAHFLRDALTGAFARASRGVGIHHLGAQAMSEWQVSLPPLDEQRRLADAIDSYLSRLDAAVAGLKRVQANLKRYRASVLKAAVEGRLVPTEAELARAEGRTYEPATELLARILKERRARWEAAELAAMQAKDKAPENDKWRSKYEEPAAPDIKGLPALPEGWCWTTVDAVGDVLLGRQRAPQFLTGRWSRPYLRVANIKDDEIDFGDVEEMDFAPAHFEKYQLQVGDILVSEGQSPHLVGQSAIYRGRIAGLCFQKTLHRFRPVAGGPSSEFAQTVFRAHVKDGVFMRMASITTNIAHLTLIKFRESRFPLPPRAEQERIVSEVQRILSVAEEIEKGVATQLERCARLRQAILKWAFEGKLVDQDPNDESASALLERIRAEREATTKAKKRLDPKNKRESGPKARPRKKDTAA